MTTRTTSSSLAVVQLADACLDGAKASGRNRVTAGAGAGT